MGVVFVAAVVIALAAILFFLASGGPAPPRPAPRPESAPAPAAPPPPPTNEQFHYGFTFVTLPGVVLPNPEIVHRIETDEEARRQFVLEGGPVGSVWSGLAKQLGLDAPYAPIEITIEEQPWGRCILVTLPEPMKTPLAYFIALVPRGPDRVLYLTLEKSLHGTMIGGVSLNTRHDNYGPGPEPDKAKFLEALGPIVAGPPRN